MDNLLRGTEHLHDEAPTSGGKLVPPVISTTSPAGPPAVRIQPKPPFAFGRIRCSLSAEIAVRTAPNSPFAFGRSTHRSLTASPWPPSCRSGRPAHGSLLAWASGTTAPLSRAVWSQ